MRLYDQIVRFGLSAPGETLRDLQDEFWAMFNVAQVIDVTSVQTYLRESKSLTQDPFAMPNLAPQFPTTFYEFWTGHAGPLKGSRIGVLIGSWDRVGDPNQEETAIPAWVIGEDRWEFNGWPRNLSDRRWTLWGMEVSTGGAFLPRNTISGPSCTFTVEIGAKGTVLRDSSGEPLAGANFGQGQQTDGRAYEMASSPHLLAGAAAGNSDLGRLDMLLDPSISDDTRMHRVRWGGLLFSLLPCFFGCSLMHCRNTQLIENVPDPKLSRAFHHRVHRPLTKFYTLAVGPLGTTQETATAASTKVARSLHICRGHFSHYTEDKPLFGKYAGQFWIPAHIRGTAEAGLVAKDYAVKAPKEVAA